MHFANSPDHRASGKRRRHIGIRRRRQTDRRGSLDGIFRADEIELRGRRHSGVPHQLDLPGLDPAVLRNNDGGSPGMTGGPGDLGIVGLVQQSLFGLFLQGLLVFLVEHGADAVADKSADGDTSHSRYGLAGALADKRTRHATKHSTDAGPNRFLLPHATDALTVSRTTDEKACRQSQTDNTATGSVV